jgi:hypothetical protein
VSEGFGALQEHSQFGIGTVSLDLVALQEYSEFGSGLCLWIWWLCKSILNLEGVLCVFMVLGLKKKKKE